MNQIPDKKYPHLNAVVENVVVAIVDEDSMEYLQSANSWLDREAKDQLDQILDKIYSDSNAVVENVDEDSMQDLHGGLLVCATYLAETQQYT